MTVFNARALASLVTVAGSALSRRLTVILNALVKVSEDNIETELREAVEEAIRALFTSVNDTEGLNTLMMLLIGWCVIYICFKYNLADVLQGEERVAHPESQCLQTFHGLLRDVRTGFFPVSC